VIEVEVAPVAARLGALLNPPGMTGLVVVGLGRCLLIRRSCPLSFRYFLFAAVFASAAFPSRSFRENSPSVASEAAYYFPAHIVCVVCGRGYSGLIGRFASRADFWVARGLCLLLA